MPIFSLDQDLYAVIYILHARWFWGWFQVLLKTYSKLIRNDSMLIVPYYLSKILGTKVNRGFISYNMESRRRLPIKSWILWIFKRLWSWIDRYVGFRYIKQFCILVAIFIWVVSIVTSFFILRENHRLNDIEQKYILLHKECFKHKETMGFVNYVDHAINKCYI